MPVKGLEGMADELTLSIDERTGEYTRLTRFHPGADTTRSEARSTTTRRKYSSSAGGYLTRRSTCGWKLDIMRVGRREKFTAPSTPTSAVWFWNCRSRISETSDAPGRPGILVLRAADSRTIRIGRLGKLHVRPGWYVYVGSAFAASSLELPMFSGSCPQFNAKVEARR
jgi:hypothetical protein